MIVRALNGVAADTLRGVATGLDLARLGVWFCIGWLDDGRWSP